MKNFWVGMILVVILGLLCARIGYGYPEFQALQYTTCMTCHYSPSGGGLVRPYGKAVGQDRLPLWKTRDTVLDHSLYRKSQVFNMGARFRIAQTQQTVSKINFMRFFIMQSDIEAAISTEPVTAYAAFDPINKYVRAFHVMGSVNDLHLKVGRFRPPFGLLYRNHTETVTRHLGYVPYALPYVAEISYVRPWSEFFASVDSQDKFVQRSTLKLAPYISGGKSFMWDTVEGTFTHSFHLIATAYPFLLSAQWNHNATRGVWDHFIKMEYAMAGWGARIYYTMPFGVGLVLIPIQGMEIEGRIHQNRMWVVAHITI